MKIFLSEIEDIYRMTAKMVRMGFRTRIITASINTTETIISHLKQEYGKEDGNTGRLKVAGTILEDRKARQEATNFIIIYLYVAADPYNCNKISDIIKAWETYSELCHKFCGENAAGKMIDPNEAWILARDLREGEIVMNTCKKCRSHYITPAGNINRSGKKQFCPYCLFHESHEKIKNTENSVEIERDGKLAETA